LSNDNSQNDHSFVWANEEINSSPSFLSIQKAIEFKIKDIPYDKDELMSSNIDNSKFNLLSNDERDQLIERYKSDLKMLRREGWLKI